MSTDSLDDRRKALEEQFFQKHEKELVAKLKDAAAKEASRDELQHLTGINDPAVLDPLASLKLGGAATLVMSVYPVVEVAWADGEMDAKEKAAVLDAAKQIGVAQGTPAMDFLQKWLTEKPEPSWHTLWSDYVKALVKNMKPDDKALLKATVLGRALAVAESSGGFLGLSFRVSSAEKAVLAKLEAAFN